MKKIIKNKCYYKKPSIKMKIIFANFIFPNHKIDERFFLSWCYYCTDPPEAGYCDSIIRGDKGEKEQFCISDFRLKKNIKKIRRGMYYLRKLIPVSFNWKKSQDNKKLYGFIAQELKKVLPNIVFKNKKRNVYTVDYLQLIPLIIYGLKEIDNEIKEIKNRIKNIN